MNARGGGGWYPQYLASDLVVVYAVIPTTLTYQPPHRVALAITSHFIITFVDLLLLLIIFHTPLPQLLSRVIHDSSPPIQPTHPPSTIVKIANEEQGDFTEKIFHATQG